MLFGYLGQLGIDGAIRDHQCSEIKAYFKPASEDFAIEVEIVAFSEGLCK